MKCKPLLLAAFALATSATAASAQFRLPVIFPLGRSNAQPPAPPPTAVAPGAVTQGALVAASGTDTVYFSANGATVDPTATATLAAQARWLLANPYVTVRLEGHGGPNDSRDYALAIGDRRANAVRDFLVLQGVAPQRITVMSWGKERPGKVLIGQALVAAGPRVVTVVVPPAAPMPLPAPAPAR
jgi:peptidoglycan-associated lipoprotein